MSSVAFDTHAAANRFKRAGFTEDQVEALVDVARETTALPDVSILATKADVSRVEGAVGRLKTDVDGLKTDVEGLKADVGGLKTDMARLESNVDRLEQGLKADIARSEAKLEARIASTQVQSLTIMIAAMALTTTLGTALAKLIR
jgi:outer membrane murein-binding lipoprotein Lpp